MGDPQGFISVPCAVCKQDHSYSFQELAPWPPRNGDTRTVLCKLEMNMEARVRQGDFRALQLSAWSSPIRYNTITFRRKNHDVNPFT